MKHAWLLALALIPGCATVNKTLDKNNINMALPTANLAPMKEAFKPIGWEEERAIGGAIALEAIAQFGGLYPDGRLQRYVNQVGQAVARTSDRPGIPYHFGVLKDEQPNAFACPGGYVFVTVGMMRLIEDESELAGVLGHEIAHVADQHALKVIRRTEGLASIAHVTADYLGANPDVFDKAIEDATNAIFNKGLDQTMENEADKHGVDFTYRVGYDPAALSRVLQRVREQSETKKLQLLETHPDPQLRIQLINKRVAGKYDKATGRRLAKRYAVRTARLSQK